MNGNISLEDFILEVKEELVRAQSKNRDDAFYELHEVHLEVAFALDSSVEGKAKFLVLGVGGKVNASQTHKVTLHFKPLVRSAEGTRPSKPGPGDLDFQGTGLLPLGGFGNRMPYQRPSYVVDPDAARTSTNEFSLGKSNIFVDKS